MSENERQLNQWVINFAQAKTALRNMNVLVRLLSQGQIDVVSKLKSLFQQYNRFICEDNESYKAVVITDQIRLFEQIEHNMHLSTTNFSAKAMSQVDSARTQVGIIYQQLAKLRSLKPPQYEIEAAKLSQQVPQFLNVFDAFLARFTLEIRFQQAEFFKQLGDAFKRAKITDSISSIVESWSEEFKRIMAAVEALKSVKPQTAHANNSHISHLDSEKIDSVLTAPMKWIHSKLSRDLKDFKFDDPRTGFFNKPTLPPHHERETVKAIFDFKGETDSDLVFKTGDVIALVDKGTDDDPNWWCGEIDGKRGLFPRNYVEEISNNSSRYSDISKSNKSDLQQDEYVPRLSSSDIGSHSYGDLKTQSKNIRMEDTTGDVKGSTSTENEDISVRSKLGTAQSEPTTDRQLHDELNYTDPQDEETIMNTSGKILSDEINSTKLHSEKSKASTSDDDYDHDHYHEHIAEKSEKALTSNGDDSRSLENHSSKDNTNPITEVEDELL